MPFSLLGGMDVRTGEQIVFRVDKISSDGSGIARGEDGMVVFIPGALPGETVLGRITVKKREYAIAEPEEILSPSPGRIAPLCPWYGKCGGCQLQHASYGLQLKLKELMVHDAFQRIYKGQYPSGFSCAPSPEEWRYRNKASFPVRTISGKPRPGFFARRSHELVPVDRCPLISSDLEAAFRSISSFLPSLGIQAYDERTGKGAIRHLILRHGLATGDVLASLVLKGSLRASSRQGIGEVLLPALKKAVPGLRTLTLNRNDAESNVIVGETSEALWGDGLVEEAMGRLRFRYDTTSFFQVNALQAFRMYEYAAGKAVCSPEDTVLELYSGIGTLTAFLAGAGSHVTAVEEWPRAVERMEENLRLNGLDDRVTILPGAAETYAPSLRGKFRSVLLDPPRTGCNEQVLRWICGLGPERIVYVSCNPATLARDGALLGKQGYFPEDMACFDMFPQTVHVETVVLFERSRTGQASGTLEG